MSRNNVGIKGLGPPAGPGGGYGALCDCGNLEVIGALAGFGALSALLAYAISSSSSTTTDDMARAYDTNAFTAQVLGEYTCVMTICV